MSIATDEAAQKYPEPTDADDPMCKYVEAIAGCPAAKRQGYVAGRTAEPTDAEIEASAFAQFKAINNSSWKLTEKQYREAWNALPDMVSDDFLCKARICLAAARKVVTVDE
jgi:hypothetical protein